ncbi:MAG TPA: hypothetical protein VFW09_09720 [Solirubrobacteraceae bacterium]|nr:hypothetical protein [Solirubrobacteraceae bacterium]
MRTLNLDADLPSLRPRLIVLVLALLSALLLAAAPAHPRMMQVDPQTPCVVHGDNVQSILQAHDATVLRIVLPYFPSPNALRCVERAKAQGYHVYVSLQYDNAWSPTRVASYFARTLPPYAPYAWAVSVGNEQDIGNDTDLPQGAPPRQARVCTGTGPRRRCQRSAGAYYRRVWNAVEPVVARVAPNARRVYGETTPWGFSFLKDSFQTGRPRGAQAVAFHCYDTKWGGLRAVPRVAAWAGKRHLPLWCSEMSDALRPLAWGRRDTPWQWQVLLAGIERRSPDLKMVSYYQWRQIGAP